MTIFEDRRGNNPFWVWRSIIRIILRGLISICIDETTGIYSVARARDTIARGTLTTKECVLVGILVGLDGASGKLDITVL